MTTNNDSLDCVAIRNAVLDEAIAECERIANSLVDFGIGVGAGACSDAIRNLKSGSTQPSDSQAEVSDIEPDEGDVFRALIKYLLKCDEPISFLHCWNEGNWKGCREWEDAPEILFHQEKNHE